MSALIIFFARISFNLFMTKNFLVYNLAMIIIGGCTNE